MQVESHVYFENLVPLTGEVSYILFFFKRPLPLPPNPDQDLLSIQQVYRQSFAGITREVWLLAIVMLINRSGTMVLPFLTVYITQELGFSIQNAGLVSMSYGLGSVLGTVLGGHFSDRYGYYPVMFWSLTLSGFVLLGLQWVTSLFWLCLIAFLLSTVADMLRPANMSSVALFSSPETRIRSVALVRLAINLGWGIGPALGGVAAFYLGYKWLFWIDGLTCLFAAAFYFHFLPRSLFRVRQSKEKEQHLEPTISVYRDWTFLEFVFWTMLSAAAFFQLLSTVPVYYKENLHMDENIIGLVLGLNGFLVALLEMPVVFALEKRVKMLKVIFLGTILIGLSYWILNWGAWIGLAYISTVVMTLGEVLTMPFANAYSMVRSNAHNRGRYIALYALAYSIAFIIAPLVGTQIAGAWSFAHLWYTMLLLSLISAAGFWRLQRRTD